MNTQLLLLFGTYGNVKDSHYEIENWAYLKPISRQVYFVLAEREIVKICVIAICVPSCKIFFTFPVLLIRCHWYRKLFEISPVGIERAT